MKYEAVKCNCGNKICKDWHISDIADLQGVKFTEEQAIAVANLLNNMEEIEIKSIRKAME